MGGSKSLAAPAATAQAIVEEPLHVACRIAGIIRANGARQARADAAGASEMLWGSLHNGLGRFTFRRRCVIGGCAVEFLCVEVPLVIQVDGDRQSAYEARSTVVLAECGFRVLRFWGDEIAHCLDGVLADILVHLEANEG